MNITEITVSAGRTFGHPYEQFSNLKPQVTLKATLAVGEDPIEAARTLQAKAECLVEDHKQNMLKSISELHRLGEVQSEVAGLERTLRNAQERLSQIRNEHPQLLIIDKQ